MTNINMSECIRILDSMGWCDIYERYVHTPDAIAEYYESEIVEDHIYGGQTETNERIKFNNGLIMYKNQYTGEVGYEFEGGGRAWVQRGNSTGVFEDLYGVRHDSSRGTVRYGIRGTGEAGTYMYWANYEEFISEYKAYVSFS